MLTSARLTAKEQACGRCGSSSKNAHAAVRTLRQRRSLAHRHFRFMVYQAAARTGKLWKHQFLAARAVLPTLSGRPPVHAASFEVRWKGDQSMITGIIYGDGPAYKGQHAHLCVVGSGAPAVSGTLPSRKTWKRRRFSRSSCSCVLRGRQPSMSPTAASLNSASARGEGPPPWGSYQVGWR